MLCVFNKALAALLLARTPGDNSWIVGNPESNPDGHRADQYREAGLSEIRTLPSRTWTVVASLVGRRRAFLAKLRSLSR
jgi:hypothetical protein